MSVLTGCIRTQKAHCFATHNFPFCRGYPRDEWKDLAAGGFPITASFTPKRPGDPVLFHFVLPNRFVPRGNTEPLVQPCSPFIGVTGERLSVTYPVSGATTAEVRFFVEQMRVGETFEDYNLDKVLHPDPRRGVRCEFELNLGLFKVKLA